MKKLIYPFAFAALISMATAQTPLEFSPYREVVSCGPTTVYFVFNNALETDQIYWDFGDGTGAGISNPSHTYSDLGIYTVKLTLIRNGIKDSVVKNNFVEVRPNPLAQMKVEQQREGLFNQFIFTSQSNHNADSFSSLNWYIGKDILTGEKVYYTFPSKGDYTVTLVATNNAGCSHESSAVVKVPDTSVDPVGIFENGVHDKESEPYPNPANEIISIKAPASSVKAIYLTDLLGKTYRPSIGVNNDILNIDTRTLISGVYFISIIQKSGIKTTRRIVISH